MEQNSKDKSGCESFYSCPRPLECKWSFLEFSDSAETSLLLPEASGNCSIFFNAFVSFYHYIMATTTENSFRACAPDVGRPPKPPDPPDPPDLPPNIMEPPTLLTTPALDLDPPASNITTLEPFETVVDNDGASPSQIPEGRVLYVESVPLEHSYETISKEYGEFGKVSEIRLRLSKSSSSW